MLAMDSSTDGGGLELGPVMVARQLGGNVATRRRWVALDNKCCGWGN
jgi:hypothetical protein